VCVCVCVCVCALVSVAVTAWARVYNTRLQCIYMYLALHSGQHDARHLGPSCDMARACRQSQPAAVDVVTKCEISTSGARFTKYLTTVLRLSYVGLR